MAGSFCFCSVLYIQDSLEGESRVFLDPNTLSEDGTTALSQYEFSKDGELFAYGLSSKGSDWVSIRVRNVSSGRDYPEVLTNVKFSGIAWLPNNEGFFYAVSEIQKISCFMCFLLTAMMTFYSSFYFLPSYVFLL